MISFLKKDFLMMKANGKIFLIACIVYIFMSMTSDTDISMFLPFFTIIIYLSTFNYDDFNNWNAYASTLPCGRKNAIKGKYLGTIIALLGSFVIAILSSIIVNSFKNSNFFIQEILFTFSFTCIIVSIFISISYPLIYKFGVSKGKIWSVVVYFVSYFILTLLIKIIGFDVFDAAMEFYDKWQFILSPLVFISSFGISYFLSIKIYLKKEF